VGLPDGEKTLQICNCLDSIPVHDGWTDRQASCHSIVRAVLTHRVVKTLHFLNVADITFVNFSASVYILTYHPR